MDTTKVNDNTEDDNIETKYKPRAKKKQKELERSSLFQRSWLDWKTVLQIGRSLLLPRKQTATIKVNNSAKSSLLYNLSVLWRMERKVCLTYVSWTSTNYSNSARMLVWLTVETAPSTSAVSPCELLCLPEVQGLSHQTHKQRTTSMILHTVNVVFSNNFIVNYLAINDCKSQVDHEMGTTHKDFSICACDAHNATLDSSDDEYEDNSDYKPLFYPPGDKYLADLEKQEGINVHSVNQFTAETFQKKIMDLFAIW
jgi:hypothetical protein